MSLGANDRSRLRQILRRSYGCNIYSVSRIRHCKAFLIVHRRGGGNADTEDLRRSTLKCYCHTQWDNTGVCTLRCISDCAVPNRRSTIRRGCYRYALDRVSLLHKVCERNLHRQTEIYHIVFAQFGRIKVIMQRQRFAVLGDFRADILVETTCILAAQAAQLRQILLDGFVYVVEIGNVCIFLESVRINCICNRAFELWCQAIPECLRLRGRFIRNLNREVCDLGIGRIVIIPNDKGILRHDRLEIDQDQNGVICTPSAVVIGIFTVYGRGWISCINRILQIRAIYNRFRSIVFVPANRFIIPFFSSTRASFFPIYRIVGGPVHTTRAFVDTFAEGVCNLFYLVDTICSNPDERHGVQIVPVDQGGLAVNSRLCTRTQLSVRVDNREGQRLLISATTLI